MKAFSECATFAALPLLLIRVAAAARVGLRVTSCLFGPPEGIVGSAFGVVFCVGELCPAMFVPSALTSTATEAPCGRDGGGAWGLAERVLGPSASATGAGETHRSHCELGQARGHKQLLWLVNEL